MKKVLYIMFDIVSLFIFLFGALFSDFNLMLLGILILLSGNFIFAFVQIERYIIFFLFNISMFLFLIGRPFVSMIRGSEWWSVGSKGAVYSALISLYLSLLFMWIGSILIDKISFRKSKLRGNLRFEQKKDIKRRVYIKKLQQITMLLFYISIIATFAEGWEKISFMQNNTYMQYYTSYKTSQSILVKAFIQLMKPTLCIFLATMPTKRKSFLPLLLFLISTLPQLVVGMRSPTMLACMFIFSYYYLRDLYSFYENEKWIGKLEKIVIIIILPFIIVFLYGYNYWRTGRTVEIFNGSSLILNFLYQQGNSFEVLVQGFEVMDLLPLNTLPGYMFGPIYDNFVYNSLIGRLLFGTVSINNQSLEAIKFGHDMKAHLSYTLMGNSYLQGAGVGTVHILEIVHDIGWIGLLLYNIVLGMAMVKVVDWFGKYLKSNSWIISTLCIYGFLQLYYTPRSDAIYMISPVFSPYFWICVIGCMFIAKLKIPLLVWNKK